MVLVLVLLGPGLARGAANPVPGSRESPQWVILDERPGQGEQCLVGRERIFDKNAVEIRFQGRRFYVCAPALADFRDDPDGYFARLQARSALFNENALRARPMAFGWLWFGMYVMAGLVFSAVCTNGQVIGSIGDIAPRRVRRTLYLGSARRKLKPR